MFRQILSEFTDEAAFLTAAFFTRNAITLILLATVVLVALARP
jgi:hypothetical protein